MYLSRYTISNRNLILEIEPSTGRIVRRFPRPNDWKRDHYWPNGHWERFRGKIFSVFEYNGAMVFQEGKNRFVLDNSYSCKITPVKHLWRRFTLFCKDEPVYEFIYLEPQNRFWSIVSKLVLMDDWWDWDTPFEDVKVYLETC